LSAIAYSLPSRRQRRQEQRHISWDPSMLLLSLIVIAGYYILTTDFSHLNRNWLPLLSSLVAGSYIGLGLWGLVRLVQSISLPNPFNHLPEVDLSALWSSSPNLINSPRLKGYWTRLLETIVSLSAWGIFLYFFQPLFTGLFWLVTGQWVYWHVFSSAAIEGTLDMLFETTVFAFVIVLVFVSWAKWNIYHYGGLDRRKPRSPIQNAEVAAHFLVPISTVNTAQSAKIAYINSSASVPVFTVNCTLPSAIIRTTC